MFLLLFSITLDYLLGIKIQDARTHSIKRIWLWLSIVVNVGFLGVFKYFNFFVESFAELFSWCGFNMDVFTLSVIIPVDISFYTFHGLSYVIDLYKGKILPERNFIDYGLFVSYFPLLVAGPIERSTHLLPQLKRSRVFSYNLSVDGMRQILWGLFKKVVIADNCAQYVNMVFLDPPDHNGSTLIVGAVLFAFQIYGDFSGYSDIALGASKLFGIELLRNFSYPYFSRSVAEFWRRWHISLSSWFRDYVYIPMGGSSGRVISRCINVLVIFLISGFWHGANWTFIIWGLVNGLFILPSIVLRSNRHYTDTVAMNHRLPNFKELLQMSSTFILVTLTWIFFRSPDVESAFNYISGIYSVSIFTFPETVSHELLFLLIFFIIVEWIGRNNLHPLAVVGIGWNRYVRRGLYYLITFLLFWCSGIEQQFIYFQF